MRKINVIFFLIVLSLILLSAASIAFSQSTKKTLELPDFKSIYVNSNYTVMLKQTNKQEVVVEAPSDIMEASEIKVENGILLINIEHKPDSPNKSIWAKIDDIKMNPNMKVYVSMKNVGELMVNGSGKIISENSIAADYISLGLAGSGMMDVDLKGNTVKAEVSGSGTLTLRGYATSLDLNVSGSGDVKAYDCPVETCKAKMSGSGNAELNVSSSLEAMVLGSGSLKHKGNTRTLTKKVYGSGAIDRAY
ncbi:MAG TPA: head GIN domain-containing protein [Cyclobacteriaceae bacterium]|nr:head GIN domain-containing protein [Cyclobacteriaceae bacterium]